MGGMMGCGENAPHYTLPGYNALINMRCHGEL